MIYYDWDKLRYETFRVDVKWLNYIITAEYTNRSLTLLYKDEIIEEVSLGLNYELYSEKSIIDNVLFLLTECEELLLKIKEIHREYVLEKIID